MFFIITCSAFIQRDIEHNTGGVHSAESFIILTSWVLPRDEYSKLYIQKNPDKNVSRFLDAVWLAGLAPVHNLITWPEITHLWLKSAPVSSLCHTVHLST